jgi:hypothetical protein
MAGEGPILVDSVLLLVEMKKNIDANPFYFERRKEEKG